MAVSINVDDIESHVAVYVRPIFQLLHDGHTESCGFCGSKQSASKSSWHYRPEEVSEEELQHWMTGLYGYRFTASRRLPVDTEEEPDDC